MAMETTAAPGAPPGAPLITLDARRRATLPLGRHRRYLMSEEADGTLILRPAVIVPVGG